MVMMHVFAIVLGMLFYSVEAVCLGVSLSFYHALQITLVYHRYLTHQGFKTWAMLRNVLSVSALLAGEGPPLIWVANHRKHHKFSDKPGDPHSPLDGFMHSHMWWMMYFIPKDELAMLYKKYAKDLLQEPFMCFLNKTYLWWHVGFALCIFVSGWLYGGWFYAMSFLAWIFFVRMCLVWHITWFVNSATHRWGYRNYDTKDNSRNLWWVALLAMGEGWHNNHHKYPQCIWHGHKWWELDPTGRIIWILKKCHIAKNCQDDFKKIKRSGTPRA